MALQANALITLNQAKDYLSISLADTSQDSWVETLINSASDRIERHCLRSFKSASRQTVFDGNGNNEVVLPHWPVTAIADVRVDSERVFGTDTKLETVDFGIVDSMVLRLHATLFPSGSQNVQVNYTAGYTAVPGDLQFACLFLVEWLYRMKNDRRLGRGSVSKGNETVENLPGMPKEVIEILEPFVNIAFSSTMSRAGVIA
jgi:uncharacterized phiE125 gp8 family phage protein